MLKFQKYEGAGNDFVMINNLEGNIFLSKEEIIKICDRHFGIGADGVILLEKSAKADCFMNYINSDGSLAEMCGNGIRCTADFFLNTPKQGLGASEVRPSSIKIDTRAGIKDIKVNNDGTYSVNMGVPIFKSSDFPATSRTGGQINIESYGFSFVSMGNPHAVTMVDNLDNINFKLIGSKVENNSLFPNKINVEFVEKKSDNYYKVKVWERGCGATLACGTGACAVFAILNKTSPKQGLGLEEITLEFPGGKLFLSENNNGDIILRGSAMFVFSGEI